MPLIMARSEVRRVSGGSDASAGFARPARLRKHTEFEKVYRNGRRLFFAHMMVLFRRRDSGPPPQRAGTGYTGDPGLVRVGITITRTLGTAAERNRIRRRLREAVRLSVGMAENAVDVVVHPKKSALTADFAELRDEIAGAFEKIQSSAVGSRSPAETCAKE